MAIKNFLGPDRKVLCKWTSKQIVTQNKKERASAHKQILGMKKTLLILIIGLCTLGTMAQPHRGERGRHGGDHDREHRREKGMAMLNLTDAQKEEIKMLRIEHEKAIKNDQQTLKLKRVELSNLVANDDPNQKDVNRLTDEIGGLQTALLKAQIAHRIEVRTLLDDEQKLKFDKMKIGRGPGGKRGK